MTKRAPRFDSAWVTKAGGGGWGLSGHRTPWVNNGSLFDVAAAATTQSEGGGLELTDLEDVGDAAGLEQLEALVEGLIVAVGGGGVHLGQRRVHANVTLVPGERPEDDPPLHWLGDAHVALLDALERDVLGDHPGADVQQRVGGVGGGRGLAAAAAPQTAATSQRAQQGASQALGPRPAEGGGGGRLLQKRCQ